MRLYLLCFSFLLMAFSGFSQTGIAPKRTLSAVRTADKIQVDGQLNEAAWTTANVANDFFRSWPNPGPPAALKTEVRVLYSDRALFVSIQCFEPHQDSITKRLAKRDQLENTDRVSFVIDAYRDGQNAVLFGVSPDNVQFDSKYSVANANINNGDADGEDVSWDAVWTSATRITENGWIAEFEIPYSALRFPKKKVQEWGINFYRSITRKGESNSWNELRANVAGSLNQMGILTGITDIKAPLRLSATPFVAGYANQQYNQPGSSWTNPYSFGMDVKYGINQAFTLDAALVPDFGQVRSDQQILNLSPFEIRFNENRPFFTEGTELFNKGGLFYSRRVGTRPVHYWDVYDQVSDEEEVTTNQSNALLINAAKISGRTQKGLGIGIFNAVEAAAHADITNTVTNERRTVETSPLTNKSVLVLDQNLKYNSSIAFINTNVVRMGSEMDANVSGLVYNLKTPKQDYGLNGKFAMSNRYGNGTSEKGYTATLEGSKTSGNFLFGGGYTLETDKYNPNDLGFLYSPNENSGFVWVNYSKYKPWWKLNNFWSSAWVEQSRLFRPNVWTSSGVGLNFGGNTRKFHNFGFNAGYSFNGENDYFEAGTEDFSKFYHTPSAFRVSSWYNSDSRKKVVANANVFYRKFDELGRYTTFLSAGLRWRASGKFTIGMNIGKENAFNNVGNLAYSTGIQSGSTGYHELTETQLNEGVFMGRRDLSGWNNDIELSYSFNNKMNLWLYVRHYWNQVKYQSFSELQSDGSLQPISYSGMSEQGLPLNDESISFFNIDLVYTWRFAPGSDILLIYKNSTSNYFSGAQARHTYEYDARNLTNYPGQNTFSVKVLYFIDFERVKGKKVLRF